MRMKSPWSALALAIAATAATAAPAHACDCSRARTGPNDVLKGADAIFLGRAVRNRLSFAHPLSETVTTFEVLRAWKGVDSRLVEVSSSGTRLPVIGGPTSCDDAGFAVGTEMLMVAWRERDRLITSVCAGGRFAPASASADRPEFDAYIRALGPDVPIPTGDTRQSAALDDLVWLAAGGTVAAAVWARRRRRRRRGAG